MFCRRLVRLQTQKAEFSGESFVLLLLWYRNKYEADYIFGSGEMNDKNCDHRWSNCFDLEMLLTILNTLYLKLERQQLQELRTERHRAVVETCL